MMENTAFENRARRYCDIEGEDSALEATAEQHLLGNDITLDISAHAQHHSPHIDPANDMTKNVDLAKRIQFAAYLQRASKHGNIGLREVLRYDLSLFPECRQHESHFPYAKRSSASALNRPRFGTGAQAD